ncbi:MAG: 50S ribosomal protein L11 methyltransferase [Cyclobacteriaceae bacterium]|nr:50S ribosomal protein L11 methyltransferase [Cyclobacteriaceae bacterium]
MKTDQPEITYTRLEVECPAEFTDILIAELAEAGFGMFMETTHGFEADAEEGEVRQDVLEFVREKYSHLQPLVFRLSSVKKENWNAKWESHVEPVNVESQVLIRAEFHPADSRFPYEIIITPKMSFGTGHHPTTYLMVKSQLSLDHQGKRVMDAGCGTAILSIMASKRGALLVEAFDIDEWSISNGLENVAINACTNIRIRRGTIADFIWPDPFDIILANINRNILMAEMADYARHLVPGGVLQLSGFYVKDIPALVEEAARHGLEAESQDEREQWATLRLRRNR